MYLIDFGIAVKFEFALFCPSLVIISLLPSPKYVEDPRKCHDGTLAYTSVDAHRARAHHVASMHLPS